MRQAHWVRHNQQERIPPRMVVFDTEARSTYDNDMETQEWRTGCAIRWRTDLSSGDKRETGIFSSPSEFWQWVSDYTRKGTRTVVWAHNLGYDVRTSDMFRILPVLGYHLEWCNLDRNISSATWRSDRGTIVIADTWTWIPLPLKQVAAHLGMVKYERPADNAVDEKWVRYCMRDTEILYHTVRELLAFISSEKLGNWQPTGAGMAYASWRHRFMQHKILVHDDRDAIQAERIAMHTGRAEAWRHGKVWGGKWSEVDLRNAYVSIAAEYELPRKLHMHTGALSVDQYNRLRSDFAILCRADISTRLPIVPYRAKDRHVWPVGQFQTWIWDAEIDCAIRHGADVKIREAYVYCRAPVLQDWARWVLNILRPDNDSVSPVAKTYVKHCARALIGRLSLRVPSWEVWGDNPEAITGITYVSFPDQQFTTRLLHVGDRTLIETERGEGENSLPQITGYIMSVCRVLLWEAMHAAGWQNIGHVDTDSLLVNNTGLRNLRTHYGADFSRIWTIKGTYTRLEIWGPRAYWRGSERVAAGIPGGATEITRGEYAGERWESLSAALMRGDTAHVSIRAGTWTMARKDPRRADSPGVPGQTRAYSAAEADSPNRSSSPVPGTGS